MASPAAAEFTQETARQSLIAISQSLPEAGSPRNSNVKPPSTPVANGYQDDGAANCRSKLMSISDLSSPDALPTPCPPKSCV
ncbi:unnamed protein product [Alopecurus aequalis]